MIDPLLIPALPSCWASLWREDLLSMMMNEENRIRALCNPYTIVTNLTPSHSAYQTHPFANALRSVTINVLTAQAQSDLEHRSAPIPTQLASIGTATNDVRDPHLNRCVGA